MEENLQCQKKAKKVVDVSKPVGSKDIEDWIRGQIVKTHKASGKAVCPFAKRTLKDKKIQIVPAKINVFDQIAQCCDLFHTLNLDICIFYFNYPITERKLKNLCARAHKRKPHYAIMYDHPDNNGKHKGVQFSFQKAPLIFVQDLAKLKAGQQLLKKTGYYKAWGMEDMEQFY